MKIYIAAAFGEKHRADELACRLRTKDHDTVSTWHESTANFDPTNVEAQRQLAINCLDEVDEAELIIVLADKGDPRGTFFEAGYHYRLQLDGSNGSEAASTLWIGGGPIFRALADHLVPESCTLDEIVALVDTHFDAADGTYLGDDAAGATDDGPPESDSLAAAHEDDDEGEDEDVVPPLGHDERDR